MKLRLTLLIREQAAQDITIECDVTTTVAETARTLIRTGVCRNRRLEEAADTRLVPVTLRCSPAPGATAWLLDPASPLGESGVQSGWCIEPITEFGAPQETHRVVSVAGYIHVLSGLHTGTQYSVVAGQNLIGRDRASRIFLSDHSVSRRHAELEVHPGTTPRILLRDLGSVNGLTIGGARVDTDPIEIEGVTDVGLGDVTLRIFPGATVQQPEQHTHVVRHMRPPQITSSFPVTRRTLPAPPAPAHPTRLPMLAMLAPMLLGSVMFAMTRSPISLIMMAFSPLMMLGAWIDGKMIGSRKLARELTRFRTILASERAELTELRAQEMTVRSSELPTVAEVTHAMRTRGTLLWARRPEHGRFGEVRLGNGTMPSRTVLDLPDRGEATDVHWEELQALRREFKEVTPVPVVERLHHCGALGIAGETTLAEGMARSLILQLTGLHSPDDLVLTCFGSAGRQREWGWLKWLPHVDPVASPVNVTQLADDEKSSARLILSLETLLELRLQQAGARRSVRSHQSLGTHAETVLDQTVRELPITPLIVVLVLPGTTVELFRLIAIAELGADVGIHLVWVAERTEELPAVCRTFIELYETEGRANFVRSGTSVALHQLEQVSVAEAYTAARSLAPVEDAATRMVDESDLPKTVSLRELHRSDLIGGKTPILQNWAGSGSLLKDWRAGEQRDPLTLSAVVGQGPDGPVHIDLRTHGPHALVGGTTGSGKSEFLQTWIMSLAAHISPERINFLLVDYKGGAAFAECTDLPHTVGLVTDLSPHLVRRALTSLRAELVYREELLARHGAKDLSSMEERSDPATPAVLVIVIDEFAALAADVPAFVDGVVDIAQRGRSLGLHLIMATQRPAGVIRENLRANTNLRIALRMADEQDSSDVIGVNDAAFLASETPGRGVIKVGPGRLSHFQTGYLGGTATAESPETSVIIRSFEFSEGPPWFIPAETAPGIAGRRDRAQHPRDIEALRDGIRAAARSARLPSPRRPWLDELPKVIDLHNIQRNDITATGSTCMIGIQDVPAEQTQKPISIDFDRVGNVAFIGASGTGKTTALISVAAVLSGQPENDPVQLYTIDAAGGGLDPLTVLPTVGGAAIHSDTELTGRVLGHLAAVIEERGQKFAKVRAATLEEFRRATTPTPTPEPRLVLLLDGFATFRHSTETVGIEGNLFQLFTEIMQHGRAVGVHVVMTADRPAAIPSPILSTLQMQFILRLANPHDYGYVETPGETLAEAPPGRAVLAGSMEELQLAVVGGHTELFRQVETLETLAITLRGSGIRPASVIRNTPKVIPLDDPMLLGTGAPVFGIDTRDFTPVHSPERGLAVISGPPGSGVSTAILTITRSHTQARRETPPQSILLTFNTEGLSRRHHWDTVAVGEDEVAALARTLTKALGGKLPGSTPPMQPIGASPRAESGKERPIPEEQPAVLPKPGYRGVIVVERPADAEDTTALPALVALAKAARRAEALVMFEFEQGTAGGIWELFSALKHPRWGLALQPDDGEHQSPFRETFGRVQRTNFPPGRGFQIENGRVTPVHVATPDPPLVL